MIKAAYNNQIMLQKEETRQREAEYEAQRSEEEKIKPDFGEYCKKISIFRAAKLLNVIYEARVKAGLEPFTHAYEYGLGGNFWLAHTSFRVAGRYGANSGDVVFVPKGIEVTGWDHTRILYVDEWEKNRIVPVYSNTV